MLAPLASLGYLLATLVANDFSFLGGASLLNFEYASGRAPVTSVQFLLPANITWLIMIKGADG